MKLLLRKRIPAGAGLGGGSADAAATLVAVRKLLVLELTDDELLTVAAGLGSDVPFCFRGGAAWMRGRGEVLEPVTLRTGLLFLVAIPPFRLATRAGVRGVGRARRSRGQRAASRRTDRWCASSRSCATTSSRRPSTSSPAWSTSGARSSRPRVGRR